MLEALPGEFCGFHAGMLSNAWSSCIQLTGFHFMSISGVQSKNVKKFQGVVCYSVFILVVLGCIDGGFPNPKDEVLIRGKLELSLWCLFVDSTACSAKANLNSLSEA